MLVLITYQCFARNNTFYGIRKPAMEVVPESLDAITDRTSQLILYTDKG
jgi:hypothetical protein